MLSLDTILSSKSTSKIVSIFCFHNPSIKGDNICTWLLSIMLVLSLKISFIFWGWSTLHDKHLYEILKMRRELIHHVHRALAVVSTWCITEDLHVGQSTLVEPDFTRHNNIIIFCNIFQFNGSKSYSPLMGVLQSLY